MEPSIIVLNIFFLNVGFIFIFENLKYGIYFFFWTGEILQIDLFGLILNLLIFLL